MTHPTPVHVLHPGYVWSADGDCHYIDAPRLARLYCVRLADCLVVDARSSVMRPAAPPDAVHLYPRRDGRYDLAPVNA